jgi:ethanolamine ammonia-lyase large subunit
MISRKERLELDALSKEVFGASSRWQKLVTKGHPELVTEEVDEVIVPEKEGDPVTKKVQVPVKTHFGANQYKPKHYTVETIREYMLDQKKQFEEIRAKIKQMQEEERVKKAAEDQARQLHNQFGGAAAVTQQS